LHLVRAIWVIICSCVQLSPFPADSPDTTGSYRLTASAAGMLSISVSVTRVETFG
jgi:hypothetical protein